MTKKTLLLFMLVLVAQLASAIPAKRGTRQVRNIDGTILTIQLCGDENYHYYATTDGRPVTQLANGDWTFASVSKKQALNRWKERLNNRNKYRLARLGKTKQLNLIARGKGNGVATQRKGLVILVNFKDVKFSSANPQAVTEQMFNSVNDPYDINTGSVHEYFLDQSYGNFDLTFDVVGPVELNNNMAYYGENDKDGTDLRPFDMVREACKKVSSLVDFSKYDWDNDGEADQVYIIYAGYGEAFQNADPDCIWPHEWVLDADTKNRQPLIFNGVRINTYACSNELYGTAEFTKQMGEPLIEGIGTACHEFSHCLGLPDMYDVDYGGNIGMDDWDLMDYGANRNFGYTPTPYTSYERWVSGWLEPTELNSPTVIENMPAITDEPVAYILYNNNNQNEYYLLENHQQNDRWDSKSSGHGMMVLHVTYDEDSWNTNSVNTGDLERMVVIPADNDRSTKTLKGDLWNGANGTATALTDYTIPAAKLNTPNSKGEYYMGMPIENISETNGNINFIFMGGREMEIPTGLKAENQADNDVLLNWNAPENALTYEVIYRGKDPDFKKKPEFSIADDFSSFPESSTFDISNMLDSYTLYQGWTGNKVYSDNQIAKLGTSTTQGELTTPTIWASDDQNVTVLVNAARYNSRENKLDVILTFGKQTITKTLENLPDTANMRDDFVNFSNVIGDYTITFRGKRAYLGLVAVFNGNYSESDFGDDTTIYPVGTFKDDAYTDYVTLTNLTDIQTVVKDLTPGWQYSFQVRAIYANGYKSSWSSPVTITIPTTTDGISTLHNNAASSNVIYDLSGRRMSGDFKSLPKGIYIINGKKYGK